MLLCNAVIISHLRVYWEMPELRFSAKSIEQYEIYMSSIPLSPDEDGRPITIIDVGIYSSAHDNSMMVVIYALNDTVSP